MTSQDNSSREHGREKDLIGTLLMDDEDEFNSKPTINNDKNLIAG